MTLSRLTLVGSYDYGLVALSRFIAILASYAALDLSGRVTSAYGRESGNSGDDRTTRSFFANWRESP